MYGGTLFMIRKGMKASGQHDGFYVYVINILDGKFNLSYVKMIYDFYGFCEMYSEIEHLDNYYNVVANLREKESELVDDWALVFRGIDNDNIRQINDNVNLWHAEI